MVLTASLRPQHPPLHVAEFDRRVEVRPLEWETNFFGERMGALVLLGERGRDSLLARSDALALDLRAALREAELDGYRHLSLRVPAEDIPAIWAAERAGLRLMDVGVDLSIKLDRIRVPAAGSHPVRIGVPADASAMQAMTVGAFGLTRFAIDPFFSEAQVDNFYKTWAANLFGGMADVVLVVEIEARPAGFIGCKLAADGTREGRISLIATAAEFQRRGVARELIASALAWFTDAGCRVASVKTQAANYPAVALYERAGFTVSRSELTFTTTLNQEI
jgi:dTDP-4-amino-4,6-dideoxy-D-galactose acyltransferase